MQAFVPVSNSRNCRRQDQRGCALMLVPRSAQFKQSSLAPMPVLVRQCMPMPMPMPPVGDDHLDESVMCSFPGFICAVPGSHYSCIVTARCLLARWWVNGYVIGDLWPWPFVLDCWTSHSLPPFTGLLDHPLHGQTACKSLQNKIPVIKL